MADSVPTSSNGLVPAADFARALTPRVSPNEVRFVSFGDLNFADADLARIVQAVPAAIAPALQDRVFYFVPLAIAEARPVAAAEASATTLDASPARNATLIAPVYTTDLADDAICHRNVELPDSPTTPAHHGVFISARLLEDKFALAFEFFINIGHIFAESVGIPEVFSTLAWSQATSEVRGETSQDAFEARTQALAHTKADRSKPDLSKPDFSNSDQPKPDEKARADYLESAFADALAIYQLSLAVDFDYSELREREYPLLTPTALAERLRLIARLFPPNPGYEFAIRYRRRA